MGDWAHIMIDLVPGRGKIPAPDALPWLTRAGELADWTLARLCNRLDCWGSYRPEAEIGRAFARPDGTKGKLGAQMTVQGNLPRGLLIRHFKAADRSHLIGTHAADKDNFGRWGCIDIDHHGDTSPSPDVNLHAALAWYGKLVRLGFRPLLTQSNGTGGYHLRVLLASPIPADRLYYFLRLLVADHNRLGFAKPPEQFPKQEDVRRCAKGLGNWLRLPGRHHKRDHWSRVWDGARWIAGHAAIDYILGLKGDRSDLVPQVPERPAQAPQQRQPPSQRRGTGGGLSDRVASYMSKLPHGGVGSGRDDVAFCFASFLVRDLNLSDAVALQWLELWDAGNSACKGADRLRQIIQSAHLYGRNGYGSGLPTGPAVDKHGHRILRATAEIY
jgi:hypothetical protein